MKYALNQFEESTNQRFDLCVFLTCTDIFRDVEWIFFDKHIHVTDIMEKRFSQMSIYHINKIFLKEIFFTNHTELITEKEKSRLE